MSDITVNLQGSATLPDGTTCSVSGPVVIRMGAPPPPPSNVVPVHAGDDLQKAINAARGGTTLVLDAGATWTGPFLLPPKDGTAPITILSAFPRPAGARVRPADAAAMAKLISRGMNDPVLQTLPGAHGYHFTGLEICPQDASAIVDTLILLGDGGTSQNSLTGIPSDLVFDRCYIHGQANGSLKRGIAANCGALTVQNCWISEVKMHGFDSQAICGWNGPGPFTIVNNQLEASGENIMFGGAPVSVGQLVPSDIVIQGNTLRKPFEWRGVWTAKNLLELKNARRVRIEGNVLENCWGDAQNGFAVQFTPRNEDGKAVWSTVESVLFTNNLIRHVGNGINFLGQDNVLGTSVRAHDFQVVNNLWLDVDGGLYNSSGHFLQMLGPQNVRVEHNTVVNTGSMISADGLPTERLTFQHNLLPHGSYGVHYSGSGVGLRSLNDFFPGYVFQDNVIWGHPEYANLYPAGNQFPAQVTFTPDWQPAGFPFIGSDGQRIGCDIDALVKAVGSLG